MQRLVHLLWGEVSLLCSSDFPERILNLCAANHISFWEVEWLSQTQLRFAVSSRMSATSSSRMMGRVARFVSNPGTLTVLSAMPVMTSRIYMLG